MSARPNAPRSANATLTSTKGPAANAAGFHQVALASVPTATNAAPMPSALSPTVSMVWADTGAAIVQSAAHTTNAGSALVFIVISYNFDYSNTAGLRI